MRITYTSNQVIDSVRNAIVLHELRGLDARLDYANNLYRPFGGKKIIGPAINNPQGGPPSPPIEPKP